VHFAEVMGQVAQAPVAARGHREIGSCPVEDAYKGRSLTAQHIKVIHVLDPGTEVQARSCGYQLSGLQVPPLVVRARGKASAYSNAQQACA